MAQGVPGKFGKCVVVKRLGQGATALVYLARHEGLGMPVAVKVLRRRLSEDRPEYAERFLREARMAARLAHPNIVRVIDCGIEAGYHYMVMDYVDGKNCLQMLRDSDEEIDWRKVTQIIRQAALGLCYAAGQGVIHRDVKPSNIMIDTTGRVRVTDLGLAKLTVQGVEELTQELQTVGTPNYMSPEQIRSPARLDLRADIYSLGATYYHLVTGRPPFIGENPMDVVSRHLAEPLLPPYKIRRGLPAAVSKVISKMMAKSAEQRYPDYDSLDRDLDNLLEGKEVTALSFEDTYMATEEDEKLVALLERLTEGAAVEIEDDEDLVGAVEPAPGEVAQGESSAIAPFDPSDLALYRTPAEEESTLLSQRTDGQAQSVVWLIIGLVAAGLIVLLGIALLAALASQ